jgi:hypothetical protein
MQMRRKKTCYRGLSIIETAIVLPILVLVTLGVIHFAWLFLKAHQVTTIARHGARLAALYEANRTEVGNHIQSLLSNAGIEGATVAFDDVMVDGHDSVRVRITVPGANVAILNLSGFGVLTPENLGAAATMVKEGS